MRFYSALVLIFLACFTALGQSEVQTDSLLFRSNNDYGTTINGWIQRDLSIKLIQDADSFEVLNPNCKIVSWQFVLDPKDGNPFVARLTATGSYKKIAMNQLKDLEPGDRVIIDVIRGENANGLQKLLPIIYHITE